MSARRFLSTLAAMTLIAAALSPVMADTKVNDSDTKAPARMPKELLRCHDTYDPTVNFGGIEKGATYQANQVLHVHITISCYAVKAYEESGQYDGVIFRAVLVPLSLGMEFEELITTFPAMDHPYTFDLDLNGHLPGVYQLVLAKPDDVVYLFTPKIHFTIAGNYIEDAPSGVLDGPQPERK